jgi:hypothetical protein
MTTKLKLGLLTGAATLALAACGGGGNGYGGGGVYPPPVVVKVEEKVAAGSGFAALYQASANSDPSETNANSVPALSLTTDPIAVP